jgi:hypothetical protein
MTYMLFSLINLQEVAKYIYDLVLCCFFPHGGGGVSSSSLQSLQYNKKLY